MRHLMKIPIALVAVAVLSASAIAEECVPQPPKELEGGIMFVEPVRPSVALTYFEDNGCDWNGNDQLNGSDAYVFDVTDMSGPATISGAPQAGLASAYEAVAFDKSCARLGDPFHFGSFGQQFVFEIPLRAKWLGVQGSTASTVVLNTVASTTIKLQSHGKECKEQEKKKKKKKKKKKNNKRRS